MWNRNKRIVNKPFLVKMLTANKNHVKLDLFPKQVTFDVVWERLKLATLTFIAGPGHLSKAVWKERFSDVYALCIATPTPFGPRLYRELKDFYDQHVATLSQQINAAGEENFLAEYNRCWQTYSAGILYMNQLYWYLNTYVVKRYKYCEVQINFADYGIDYDNKMIEIGQLALKVWEQEMVFRQRDLLIGQLLKEIDRDRNGYVVNHSVLQGVIKSLIQLRQFKSQNKLKLYEDLFEGQFFKESAEFFNQESLKLRDTCDCSTFMAKLARRLNDEEFRARQYLHESSHQRLTIECQLWLLQDSTVEYLNSNCRSLVQKEMWNDLATMHKLLSSLDDDKIGTIVTEVERHLTETALLLVQSVDGDDGKGLLTTKVVDAIAQFYATYKEHIVHTFQSKAHVYLSALDKACSVAVNYKGSSETVSKFPELLSRYCDDLLKKNAKGLSESEMDDRLNQVVKIFKYVEDKDLFEKFYSRSLAKRLIRRHLNTSLSMEMEEAMIYKLKEICGHDYTRKLHLMFLDVRLSPDLNSQFSDFLQSRQTGSSPPLSHAVNITVLQNGVWPIRQYSSTAFYLPKEFERSVQLFENFYLGQFSGRKLTWLHHLSHVDVRLGFSKRSYLATVDMYIIGILLAFNDNLKQTFAELKALTRLEDSDLSKCLRLLIDAKILTSDKDPANENSVFELNTSYNNKRTKFKILLQLSSSEVKEESLYTQRVVEEDRRFVIQAVIVRIMKARQELSHSALVTEVIEQSKRFSPTISVIKKCIDLLIEKDYMARASHNSDNYVYIA